MIKAIRIRARDLLQGFWLIPGVVVLAFAALAVLLLALDRSAGPRGLDWAYGGQAAAARQMLTIVASSLITVAGVAFSITIVTLQLVSSQFTPRALRGFLSDRVNQVVAGVYVGIFVYCLLVLRTVEDRAAGDEGFVPSLSVTVALAAGLAGFSLLLVFLHHMAQSIKVSNIASGIARGTLSAVGRLYPHAYGARVRETGEELVRRWHGAAEPAVVRPSRPGYVQAIAADAMAAAVVTPARIAVPVRVGDFVTERDAIVAVWPGDAVDERVARRLRRAVNVADERDHDEDVSFGIRQLADIALRAISPGINDPTTALTCIRYFEAVVARIAAREIPSSARRLRDGGVTAVLRVRSFDDYVEEAFLELGRYGSRDARVAVALLEAIHAVLGSAVEAGGDERAAVLRRTADAVAQPALDDARTDRDREQVQAGLERVARLAA